MKLILIRHAEPNYAGDCLTPYGHQQAALLGEYLAEYNFDDIYISPLGRAQLTADYIVKRHDCTTAMLPWLEELNGNYRDELWSWDYHGCDLHQRNVNWSQDNWVDNVLYGQHMDAIAKKFYTHFDAFMLQHGYQRDGKRYRLLSHASEKTIVFICHAGVIATLLGHLLHIPLPIIYAHFEISPSSITEVGLKKKAGHAIWRLNMLNNMSHTAGVQDNSI